ncbi:hypothetical protein PBS_06250 [Paraburkholderia sp. 2C]
MLDADLHATEKNHAALRGTRARKKSAALVRNMARRSPTVEFARPAERLRFASMRAAHRYGDGCTVRKSWVARLRLEAIQRMRVRGEYLIAQRRVGHP